jgi:hypothetical protein
METTKICKRLHNLSIDLKNSCTKDIITIFDTIFEEYDIVYKNTNQIVDKKMFADRLRDLLDEKIKEEIPICRGFSQNGNKCFKRSQQNSNYCKVHAYLVFREDQKQCDLIEQIGLNRHNIDVLSLEKTFINDSFYYHDKRFIYHSESLEKVGYIENQNDFILTDDPFVLEIL